ncbi:MAG: hypothetical protein N2444_04575 [Methylocystis sp.]|nr:hypothetical protein [Methylocystis sp.]
MKSRKIPFAIALLGAYASTAIAFAGPGRADDLTLSPMQAASFNIGARHLVSYFVVAENGCKLTVMIADALEEDAITETGPASRLQLAVNPGKNARLDTADGGAASFACAEDARAMTVSKIERLATAPATE